MMKDQPLKTEVMRVNVRFLVGAVLIGTFVLNGCGPVPMTYVLSDATKKALDEPKQELLSNALDAYFGTPDAPKIPEPLKRVLKGDEAKLAEGATSYRRLCMHCHGLSGDGGGPTAKFVLPVPRDYRKGLFKFTSTDQTASPTRDDLKRTLLNGIPGTSMPSFALFKEQEVENILDYVILLSVRGLTEAFVVDELETGTGEIDAATVASNSTAVSNRWVGTETRVVTPKAQRTTPDVDSIERGRQLYLSDRAQCKKCHGPEGLGDGLMNDPNADPKDTKDSWGNQARPANLTVGVYRGGGRPIDLFRRIHSGIKGTPMPGQSTNLQKEEEIWDLVNYIKSLPFKESTAASSPGATAHGAGGQ